MYVFLSFIRTRRYSSVLVRLLRLVEPAEIEAAKIRGGRQKKGNEKLGKPGFRPNVWEDCARCDKMPKVWCARAACTEKKQMRGTFVNDLLLDNDFREFVLAPDAPNVICCEGNNGFRQLVVIWAITHLGEAVTGAIPGPFICESNANGPRQYSCLVDLLIYELLLEGHNHSVQVVSYLGLFLKLMDFV